ncbi:Bug family tripartite tricarboxylate transporter substrate binding protein [Achromobacter aloeverae]
MRTLYRIIVVCLGIFLSHSILAAPYPERPIRIIVAFPPGGGTDTAARLVAEQMSSQLKQSVIVENRSGAGGIIGAQYSAHAPADGYTLFFGSSAELLINPLTRKQAPYDLKRDFAPIGEAGVVSFTLVVPAASPIKNVQDLVAQAKAKPHTLNFSSFGVGSTNHLIGELFLTNAHVSATHIPYQGSAAEITALLAGEIDFTFETAAIAIPLINAGKIRALATPSPRRLAVLPDLPTLKELGYPAVVAEGWMGLFAPAGTPADVVGKLSQALNAALDTPSVRKAMADRGVDVVTNGPEAFRSMLNSEQDKWAEVVRKANIELQ